MFVEMMIIIPQVSYGAGRHVHYIEPKSNVVTGLHLNFVTQPLCLIGLCLTKVSVGLFLLRLTPSVRFRRIIWGVIIFTVLSSTGNFCKLDCGLPSFEYLLICSYTVTVFFQCKPLAFAWDHNIPGGECIPAGNLKFAAFFNSSSSTTPLFQPRHVKSVLSTPGVSALTDLLFALLPIPMLWKVQLNWKVKTAVAGVLSLGIL
jgi:rhodopsin domain-containing protein